MVSSTPQISCRCTTLRCEKRSDLLQICDTRQWKRNYALILLAPILLTDLLLTYLLRQFMVLVKYSLKQQTVLCKHVCVYSDAAHWACDAVRVLEQATHL